MNWHLRILATHEEPQELASGPWRGDSFLGVALPSRAVLGLRVWLRLREGAPSILSTVADVGPWAIDDEAYVMGDARPRAEIHKGGFCRRTAYEGVSTATVPDGAGGYKPALICNGAGIDLFPGTAAALGVPVGINVLLDWAFETEPEKERWPNE